MILKLERRLKFVTSYTRTRGDDPSLSSIRYILRWLYPHTRGWSCACYVVELIYSVIPAHAGMIPKAYLDFENQTSYTRTRGDDPK